MDGFDRKKKLMKNRNIQPRILRLRPLRPFDKLRVQEPTLRTNGILFAMVQGIR